MTGKSTIIKQILNQIGSATSEKFSEDRNILSIPISSTIGASHMMEYL
jgi:hypothetical protein